MKKLVLLLTLTLFAGAVFANPQGITSNTHSTTTITNGSQTNILTNGVNSRTSQWDGTLTRSEAGIRPEMEFVGDPDEGVIQPTGRFQAYYDYEETDYTGAYETTSGTYSSEFIGSYSGVELTVGDGRLMAVVGERTETEGLLTGRYDSITVGDMGTTIAPSGGTYTNQSASAVFDTEGEAVTWLADSSWVDADSAGANVPTEVFNWGEETGSYVEVWGYDIVGTYSHTEETTTLYDRLYLNHNGY